MPPMNLDPSDLFQTDAIKGNDAGNLAGRKNIMQDCLNFLGSRGNSCVIFGERGVGKTSLAWQIATVLDDSNSKFKKRTLMDIGGDKKYLCVFHKCSSKIDSVGKLLLHIMRPTSDPYSLSKVCHKVYEDDEVKTDLERKYKFNLFTLANVELTFTSTRTPPTVSQAGPYEHLTSEENILFLFDDVTREIRSKYSNAEIVFFVDEIDQTKISDGLGAFIKNVNNAQFVFIGIADSVSGIIKDYESAGRRLIGGDFEVPALNNDEIRWVFQNAEKRSGGTLEFSVEFLSKVMKYSAGFPWIAQNIGFQAIYNRLTHSRSSRSSRLRIEENEFKPALDQVISIYERELPWRLRLEKATDGVTKGEVLEVLWEADSPQTTEQIRIGVVGRDKRLGRHVPTALQRLREDGVIVKLSNKRWKFTDPIIRLLWRSYIDSLPPE